MPSTVSTIALAIMVAHRMAEESLRYSKCVSEILAYSLACKMLARCLFFKDENVCSGNYLQSKCHQLQAQLLNEHTPCGVFKSVNSLWVQ